MKRFARLYQQLQQASLYEQQVTAVLSYFREASDADQCAAIELLRSQ